MRWAILFLNHLSVVARASRIHLCLALLPFFVASLDAGDPAGVYQPALVKEVLITDPFWLDRLHTYRDQSISAGWQYVDGPLQEL